MKHNRPVLIILSILTVAAVLISACSSAATNVPASPTVAVPTLIPPTAMPPTAVPPTAVPPTEVPPTAAPTTAILETVTLTVTGGVTNELKLTDADLHNMNVVTLTLTHPKKGDTQYTGVRLNDILDKAGIMSGATDVTFTASDGFSNTLDIPTVTSCADCLVAFDPNTAGVYNLAMPGQTSGKAWVNGLATIKVVALAPVTLTVNGLVDNELKLTDAELHGMNVVTLTLTHPKKGDTKYTGVRLSDILKQAGIQSGAKTVSFMASDGFTYDADLATVQACTDCLVAFDSTTPGVYNLAFAGQTSGKAWVNGLVTITVK